MERAKPVPKRLEFLCGAGAEIWTGATPLWTTAVPRRASRAASSLWLRCLAAIAFRNHSASVFLNGGPSE